jgi:hypothetical protein
MIATLNRIAFFLIAAVFTAKAQLVTDDFNDGVIDTSKWGTSTFGSGTVTEDSGTLNLTNRGRIVCTTTFPLGIALDMRVTFSGAVSEEFKVVLRTDGAFGGAYGETLNGVVVALRPSVDKVEIIDFTAGGVYLQDVPYVLNTGLAYDLRITDDGSTLNVYVNDFTTPVATASTASNSGTKLSVYNREAYPPSNHITNIDHIRAVAYPLTEFQTWYESYHAGQGHQADPDADDNRNGLSNFAEFAFAVDLLSGQPMANILQAVSRNQLTYRRPKGKRLTYTLERKTSALETTWQTATPVTHYTETVVDEGTTELVQVNLTASPIARTYYRVRVAASAAP